MAIDGIIPGLHKPAPRRLAFGLCMLLFITPFMALAEQDCDLMPHCEHCVNNAASTGSQSPESVENACYCDICGSALPVTIASITRVEKPLFEQQAVAFDTFVLSYHFRPPRIVSLF